MSTALVSTHKLSKRNPSVGDALRFALLIGDSALFLGCQLVAFWLRLQSGVVERAMPGIAVSGGGPASRSEYFGHMILGTLLFVMVGAAFRIYSSKAYLRPLYVLEDLFKACAVWVAGYLLFSLFFKIEPAISRIFVILSGVLGFAVLTGWRLAFNSWIHRREILFHIQERVLVIGWTHEASLLRTRSSNGELREVTITGVIPLKGSRFHNNHPEEIPVAGNLEEIESILSTGNYDAVLLADTNLRASDLSLLVQTCHKEMVRFMAIPAFFEVLISGLHLESLRGIPILSIGRLPLDSLTTRALKRAVDILGGLVGLLLSAPVIAIFGLMVWRESPGPIFYHQLRSGKNGRPFRIIKIRSMSLDAEEKSGARWATEEDGRRLRIGAFMRPWNIDELPQFWNILNGEMSLVGPRPERPELIDDFKHQVNYYNIRHSVKPGLTGWAAVNGWRGNTDLSERIRFDLDYIERWSILFDFYIMIRTLMGNKNAY